MGQLQEGVAQEHLPQVKQRRRGTVDGLSGAGGSCVLSRVAREPQGGHRPGRLAESAAATVVQRLQQPNRRAPRCQPPAAPCAWLMS